MKIAELRKGTPDPPAGTIVHTDDGEPNGVVLESAQQLISRHVPAYTREQQKAGLVKMIQDFNAEGMTGAKDPGISELKWTLYNELLKEGKLDVRIFALSTCSLVSYQSVAWFELAVTTRVTPSSWARRNT